MNKASLGALLVVVAALAGFFGYRLVSERTGSPTAEGVQTTPAGGPTPSSSLGASTPHGPEPDATPRPRTVPDAVPEDIALLDLDGTSRKLSEWKGRPLLINFWATWCEPCRREIPLLKSLRQARVESGLEIIGIAIDNRDAVVPYARKAEIGYPLLLGEEEGLDAAEAFGMSGVLPFSVFTDKQSRIVAVRVGELHQDEADFILDHIAKVDAGSLPLDTAKERIAAELKRLAVQRAAPESMS